IAPRERRAKTASTPIVCPIFIGMSVHADISLFLMVYIIGTRLAALPPFLQGAVPVRNEVYPTVVLPGFDSPLRWADLKAFAPALAEVLEQPSLEDSLSLCIRELEERLGEEARNPTEEDYAEVFRTRPNKVRQLLAFVKGPARTIQD